MMEVDDAACCRVGGRPWGGKIYSVDIAKRPIYLSWGSKKVQGLYIDDVRRKYVLLSRHDAHDPFFCRPGMPIERGTDVRRLRLQRGASGVNILTCPPSFLSVCLPADPLARWFTPLGMRSSVTRRLIARQAGGGMR